MAGLVELLNTKRSDTLPELHNHLGWDQKGPLAKEEASIGSNADIGETDDDHESASRHLDKFQACGAQCFHLARAYYILDFVRLGYPQF